MFVLFLSQELAGNDKFLDFAGAFADGAELHVAIKLFGWVILDESVAAVNLHTLVSDADGHFAGEKLGHTGFACETDVLLVGETGGLIFADGLTELFALLRVFHGGVERSLRHAERERGDGDASTVKNFEAADEAFAFRTEKIFARHFAIREDHF